MPTAGGVINIVSGALCLISSLIVGFIAIMLQIVQDDPYYVDDPEVIPVAIAILWISCIVVLILGIFAFIGGVFAIKRKNWGWALAGSICATLSNSILGIIAIIFIAMSRKEFSGQEGSTDQERLDAP